VRFLVDMNISLEVAAELRRQGHDAVHLRDEGLGRLDDAAVFRKAAAERRVVVTFDLDFGEVMAFARERGPGVILLRLRSVGAAAMFARLTDAIARAADALEEGAIVVVEDRRIRTRRFPTSR
jgi:predicted nuclease of predicted toxin-antitoxin system